MPRLLASVIFLSLLAVEACRNASSESAQRDQGQPVKVNLVAPYGTPVLDGSGSDEVWENGNWQPLDFCWTGAMPAEADCSGHFKLAWDENFLYILAETTDDTLSDTHTTGADDYWNDDCLAIFIDEDSSGGEHQYNYNAFEYHIALDGHVTDIAPDSTFRLYNDHCFVKLTPKGNVNIWEIALRVYDGKSYTTNAENVPKLLKNGKKLGFALAYYDADNTPECEAVISCVPLAVQQKIRSSVNADVFGALLLQ